MQAEAQLFGKDRDQRILKGLEKFKYMNTSQIAELYFSNTIKAPDQQLKKACERMKRMYDRGYVQRFRFPAEPFIFTIKGSKFSNRMQHYLMITECWLVLNRMRPAGGVLSCEVEIPQGENTVITDLLVEYKNGFRGENKLYWIEVENDSNGDIFEKLAGYEELQWVRKAEGSKEGQLVIICKKNATFQKAQSYTSQALPVRAIHYDSLATEWIW